MNRQQLTLETRSPEQTEALGRALAALLCKGTLVTLRGDLATGKTCLVKGMAKYFAQEEGVHSPTFTLVNEYGDDPTLYHVDLYRLHGTEELADLGYEELFDPAGICVVEWAERAEGLLPEHRLDIALEHAGQDHRRLTFTDDGILPDGWPALLEKALIGPTRPGL